MPNKNCHFLAHSVYFSLEQLAYRGVNLAKHVLAKALYAAPQNYRQRRYIVWHCEQAMRVQAQRSHWSAPISLLGCYK